MRNLRHDLRLEGHGYRIRPVDTSDAAFIVGLRTDPELGKYLHATSPSVDDQIAWTQRYFEREGDWYFVIEDVVSGESQGCIAIYNHAPRFGTAEWGRWIIKRGSLAALESASLIYDMGFNVLGLESMYSRTEEANLPVVSFHESLGSEMNGLVIGPEGERWTEQVMISARWSELRTGLQPRVAATAALSRR